MAKLWPAYLRGIIYAARNDSVRAGASFQHVIDFRFQSPDTPLYPMALLGRARASAAAGDPATARKYYEDFFAFWKEADADLEPLVQARREFARLR